jgi:UDP-N-acetylglucosamine diphosphorylase/glucosamine-1-phosphate N-acetyltransferase
MKIIILAAGKGKRLQSEQFNLPKVLRDLNGKPIIKYLIEQLDFIDKSNIIVVVGFMADKVMETLGKDYNYVIQNEQLGTGHAVMMAKEYYENSDDDIMVLMGDMPFIKKDTLKNLISFHENNSNDLSILSAKVKLPSSFGRIIRDKIGKITKIVEVKDANEDELKVNEVNTGIAIYKPEILKYLSYLKNDNNQKEYYLTDLVKIAIDKGYKVGTLVCNDEYEFLGINSFEDLELALSIIKGEFYG